MKNIFKNGIVHYRLTHGLKNNGSYIGTLAIDYRSGEIKYCNPSITKKDEFYEISGATAKPLETFPCLTDDSFIENRPPEIVRNVKILKKKGIVFSYKNSEEKMTLVRTIDVGSIRRLNLLPKK